MNKLNDELPPVQVENIGHSIQDRMFFSNYFQRNFYWSYGSGADLDLAHKAYFVSDYDINMTPVKMLPIVKRLWLQISSKFGIDPHTHVGRCYLLGQTKDMDGPYHDDTDEENVRTIVYYPVENRRLEHKGTQFKFDDEEPMVDYMQDHAVCFDATLIHRGLSTTSNNSLRVALVFQCIHLDNIKRFVFEDTCGNDDRLDNVIKHLVPR